MPKKPTRTAAMHIAREDNPDVASSRGKRSDPRFRQISVLVERDPYDELRRRLIGTNRDASDIVNGLIKEWVKRK